MRVTGPSIIVSVAAFAAAVGARDSDADPRPNGGLGSAQRTDPRSGRERGRAESPHAPTGGLLRKGEPPIELAPDPGDAPDWVFDDLDDAPDRPYGRDADAELGPIQWSGEAIAGGFRTIVSDYREFYGGENLFTLAVALGGAAALANTDADAEIQRWYHRELWSEDSVRVAEDIEIVGDYTLTLPAVAAAAVLGSFFPEDSSGSVVGDWGKRSLRAAAVGVPPLLLLQAGLGASRPNEHRGSRWRPFDDNNAASGHAFIGALPFLSAASLTERWYVRYPLIALSFAPAWARFNNDDHYFSQVALGWWLAYRSVASVARSDARRAFGVAPVVTPNVWGLTVSLEF